MSRAHILLGKLAALLKAAERCPHCVPPSSAFDGDHLREWERLKQEIANELAALPN